MGYIRRRFGFCLRLACVSLAFCLLTSGRDEMEHQQVTAGHSKLQSLWIESASSGDLTGMVDRRVRTYGSRLFEYMQWGIYGDVSGSAYVLLASCLRFACVLLAYLRKRRDGTPAVQEYGCTPGVLGY
jgi:hypothetical protein